VQGRRVDFALCHPAGKPRVFVEVKQVGLSDGAERQLFEYAFLRGVPLVILTDGREWSFFLPAEEGDYGERRVYKLDLLVREVGESAGRFERYLKYEAFCSGAALTSAREDYRDLTRVREVQSNFPKAWTKLVEEEDEQLLELVAECVESLCGYKPDLDTVARFLREQILLRPTPPPPTVDAPKPTSVSPNEAPASAGFVLLGRSVPCRNARDVLVNVIEALAERDPSFIDRFVSLARHGRTRRYIARDRGELYPGRPHLAEEHSHQLRSGLWLGTNLAVSQSNASSMLHARLQVFGTVST
jgi:hypothetical protein